MAPVKKTSVDTEKRAEERAPESYLVQYSGYDDLKGKSAEPVRYAATLNISKSGLCFISPKPIEKDHRLSFISDELWGHKREGVVRWCEMIHPGIYRVGVALL